MHNSVFKDKPGFRAKKIEKLYRFKIQWILLIMCYKRAFWKSLGRSAEGEGQIGV